MSSLLPTSLARQGGLMASRSLPASVAVRRTLVLAQQMRQQQRFAATTSKVATTKLSHEDALKLLNEQRSLRPNSPHFTIYQPQLTWIASIFNRITGAGVSALLYVWAVSYLALPYTGVGQVLDSAHLVQFAAMAPVWLKLLVKVPLAGAFSFHSINGLRHLLWDYGKAFSMKGVYSTGYTVIGASVLATVGLCML
ncbi:hypothetical protein FA10DRAFT_232362 [Acaromyces ingoldii]|uniref:Cytochrome b560 subunit of succinate dehydrogenase n=1 Tax=Acaromyces ingoldii TaxID=215250 RepID=A0A316YG68_9BASI|nr:hypothetical protein FA10DRAFT_232362 [Acaromyces ingoldii]PWN88209.1 hypothetical protein FA10DRAFT_232362 [Acaromyces ingoldii]